MAKRFKIVFALSYMGALVFLVGKAEQSTIPFLLNNSVEMKEEIDLENCTVYFDGCNNCRVGNEGQLACTRMFCPEEVMSEPKCLEFKEAE